MAFSVLSGRASTLGRRLSLQMQNKPERRSDYQLSGQNRSNSIWFFHQTATPLSLPGMYRPAMFSKYLIKAGYEVSVFSSSFLHHGSEELWSKNKNSFELDEDGVHYHMLKSLAYKKSVGPGRIISIFLYCFHLYFTSIRLSKTEGKPQVIVASSPPIFTLFIGILAAKRMKVPCICEVRDLWPESIVAYRIASQKNLLVRLLYRLEKWLYTQASAIIFTMEGGKDYITEKGWDTGHGGSVDLGKVYHINNGVDMEAFDYDRDHYPTCDPVLNDPSLFCVVYTGSIRHVNHLSVLVDTATYLHEIGDTRIRFLIYGNGNEREHLEDECRRRGLSNVIFKGFVDRKYVPYILSKASLNLMQYGDTPILRYGASMNKSFEYLAAGKPILGNIAPKYDYIASNGCGIMREFSSAKEYAEAILAIANMPESEYIAMCRNARATAEQFDFHTLTDQLLQVFEACR